MKTKENRKNREREREKEPKRIQKLQKTTQEKDFNL